RLRLPPARPRQPPGNILYSRIKICVERRHAACRRERELAGKQSKTGLVLPGGGARGAYQVGVLDGIASLYGPDDPVPFEIITGTSAGAMNAAYLASAMGNFRQATAQLSRVWSGLD